MINKTILLSLLLCNAVTKMYAQDKPVIISHAVNTNKSVDFNYEKSVPGSYTVILNFSRLSNCNSSERQELVISGNRGRILTLRPENESQGIGFSYTYTYLRGKLKPKYQADFPYLAPYAKGTKFKVTEAGFVGEKYFGDTAPEDWKVYNFYTTKEDTIVAVRKGIVVEVKDLYGTETSAGTQFTSKVNQLAIEHADGTIARYKGFKKGSVLVEPGQTVYPGTALAVNSNLYNREKVFTMSLAITYLKSADVESAREQTMAKTTSLYGYITPNFYTEEKGSAVLEKGITYTSSYTPEMVKKEYSKKELKLLK